MYLGDTAWPELGEYVSSETLAVVPLGSTEQHGPHLPLATDHLIAEAFAREAADRTGHLCTPTVNVGVSPHHRQFHGTMWVDPPAFRDYVESLSRNLAYHGIDRIVYVNAHGGNVAPLREVGRRLRESGIYAIEWMWNESIPDLVDEAFERNGPHAGPKETALIYHVAPGLVREDRLAAARESGFPDVDRSGPRRKFGARVSYDSIESAPNGAYGDPAEATPEVGERLFEAATDQLVALLEWLDGKARADLLATPHVDPQPGSGRRP